MEAPDQVPPPWTPPRSPKRSKKDGTPRKPRKGWGPYRSVPRERSVAFNLTLDVQNLQQQVHNMAVLRDILRTKSLLQRHTPEGSLLHVVKKYFHVFRTGSVLRQAGRKRLMDEQDQSAFMHSVMDAEVDVGNGLHSPDVMMNQMTMYSTFIKFIRLTMHSFDIVVAEDSVVITTNATLRFQILRATIEMIFPHIVAEEWLVSQLVGREVEPTIGITFFFNPEGKCCKYEVDLDFVGAFTSIVKVPEIVNMLLGRALIADNCMFGVIDEVAEPEEEKPAAAPASCAKTLEDERDALARQINDLRSKTGASLAPVRTMAPAFQPDFEPLSQDWRDSCHEAVDAYYAAFANGYQADDKANCAKSAVDLQRGFLLHRFVPETVPGNNTRARDVAVRWRSLTECFSVLNFHQKAVASVEYDRQADTCTIHSSERYILRIALSTMQLVFPHIPTYSPLYSSLLGKVLNVPAQINFCVEIDTGRICRIEERMDFAMAMRKIVTNAKDAQTVLSQAKLAVDGVSCRNEVVASSFERAGLQAGSNRPPVKKKSVAAPPRTMSINDILN